YAMSVAEPSPWTRPRGPRSCAVCPGRLYVIPMARAMIVGAGIGGLATSIALKSTGVGISAFERAAALDGVEVGAGITLWPNAIQALDRLGVGEQVRARASVLDLFEQRTRRGRLLVSWRLDELANKV